VFCEKHNMQIKTFFIDACSLEDRHRRGCHRFSAFKPRKPQAHFGYESKRLQNTVSPTMAMWRGNFLSEKMDINHQHGPITICL